MDRTVQQIDTDLMRAHQDLVRCDRRNDIAGVAEAWTKLDALLEERIHVPLQRPPSGP